MPAIKIAEMPPEGIVQEMVSRFDEPKAVPSIAKAIAPPYQNGDADILEQSSCNLTNAPSLTLLDINPLNNEVDRVSLKCESDNGENVQKKRSIIVRAFRRLLRK